MKGLGLILFPVIFGVSLLVGGGVVLAFSEDGLLPAPTFNAGLINKFRLNDQLSIMQPMDIMVCWLLPGIFLVWIRL